MRHSVIVKCCMPRQTTLLEVEADLAAGRRQLLGLLAERCTLKSATVKAKYRTKIDALADELRRLEAQRDEAGNTGKLI